MEPAVPERASYGCGRGLRFFRGGPFYGGAAREKLAPAPSQGDQGEGDPGGVSGNPPPPPAGVAARGVGGGGGSRYRAAGLCGPTAAPWARDHHQAAFAHAYKAPKTAPKVEKFERKPSGPKRKGYNLITIS